ncbi:arylsulfatase [Flammeovirga sp. MY04]|uniref:arylsulfatase n=1 Tax=Flammeovirga sp. MY04 TaxID=1191459 RepID=UPI000824F5AF|nr:arylsulfatase [Flammeovirga sp. MY04]ANQ52573.2 arylsulfatase [Flammeovirga sp. MY04]
MNKLIISTLSLLMFFSCAKKTKDNTAQAVKEERRPNIIYILADDLGYGDLGCYGQSKIETPHIDKMANEGMLFFQHYAGSTVCAPSRSALLTGLHTGHTPIRGNRENKLEGQHPLRAEAFTMAEMLQQNGYTTGAFGKWGLGFVGTEGDPNNQGFDEFYGYNCQREAHRYFPKHLWHNDQKVLLEGNDFKNTVTYSGDLIHEQALKFLEDNKDKPFFMYYPNVIPHAELIMPEGELMMKYRGKFEETAHVDKRPGANYGDENFEVKYYCSQPEPRTTFAAMVSLLDIQVGEVFAKLKELGIDDNTIVVFSSDNGPHIEGGADPEFFNSSGGLRGVKRDLYEGGIRMPMIVRWPNKVKGNSTSEHVSAFWDVMPTFAEIAGINQPKNIDGISFLPELFGKEQKTHEHLYWEFHEQGGKKAVRKGNWKAVQLHSYEPNKTRVELYDLNTDKEEKNNIASQHPEIVAELVKIMDEEHVEEKDYPFVPKDERYKNNI